MVEISFVYIINSFFIEIFYGTRRGDIHVRNMLLKFAILQVNLS